VIKIQPYKIDIDHFERRYDCRICAGRISGNGWSNKPFTFSILENGRDCLEGVSFRSQIIEDYAKSVIKRKLAQYFENLPVPTGI